MVNSRLFRALLVGVLGWLLLGASSPPPAWASSDRPGLGQEMRDYLARHPGGRAINDNEISYDGGAFVVTLRAPVQAYGADCPKGWFCFYEWPNYGYPRGQLSSCGWQYLANWGWQLRAESAHYNMTTGYVTFSYYDSPLFTVSTTSRARSDASPYRNLANYVYHRC
ncbi:hypothetical protein [Micromonospora haikouensis]|uniref:hypothetical protein n=1 Tax=Micromonospora haikouensis TaxID=686309 RepID=UPI003D755DDB